jgi:hypothetical protein
MSGIALIFVFVIAISRVCQMPLPYRRPGVKPAGGRWRVAGGGE